MSTGTICLMDLTKILSKRETKCPSGHFVPGQNVSLEFCYQHHPPSQISIFFIPNINILIPNINILRQYINILRLDINILRPDINILRPDIDILRKEIDILMPEIDILRQNQNSENKAFCCCFRMLKQHQAKCQSYLAVSIYKIAKISQMKIQGNFFQNPIV